MKVLVLGADGYLGWPACMYFSARGHDVTAVDNFFRRSACRELSLEPLFPVPDFSQRAMAWENLDEGKIDVFIGDVTEYDFLLSVFKETSPDVVIHFAEQPSAPYSMLGQDKAFFTVKNNLLSTLNVIHAVKESKPDCHIIKLGTMGEYGTPNIDIEEGWLEVEHRGRKETFLFPRQGSSLYHTTKIQDTDMLWFYVRTWGLKATDLMQGPVYGIMTDESTNEPELMSAFNYDEIFGTVLNRFIVQAVSGHPLTVYGKGNQVRGFIDIRDSMQCIYLAALNPGKPGGLRIFNQVTETFSINRLAAKVAKTGERLGYAVEIDHIENPRVEKEDHYYHPRYTALRDLGLQPHYLNEKLLVAMFEVVEKHKDSVETQKMCQGVKWRPTADVENS